MSASSSRPLSPSLAQTTPPCEPVTPASEDRTEWSTPHLSLASLDCTRPRHPCEKVDTEVRNGDCLPACFSAILEYLNQGRVASTSLVQPAARLRADLICWIKHNWRRKPVYNPSMAVHEIMHLQHAVGIPPGEAAASPYWGTTPTERLVAYESVSNSVYFGDAEMMLFASWIWEKRGIAILFRVYRGDTPVHIIDTPAPSLLRERGVTHAVVVELDHTGEVDSRAAHYRLIAGGSLSDLARDFAPRATHVPSASPRSSGGSGTKRKRPLLLKAHAPSNARWRAG